MADFTIRIDSILDGWSPSVYQSSQGSIDSSLGIDPDLPLDTKSTKASGVIVPSQYGDFSSSGLSDYPMWLITTPKGSTVYCYTADGELIEYDSGLSTENVIGTATSGKGNGAAYYNNFIYLATPTDVSRYGPLDGNAVLTNTVWTGATLGSQTAMTDTLYPDLQSIPMPNHAMHVHGDNALYMSDVLDGQGVLHKIKTRKVTDEGDTNDETLYNALDLPFGFLPTDIESFSTDLVIGAVQTSDTIIAQGKAALLFWDVTDVDSFYRGPTYLPDTILSALQNVNGVVRVFSGNAASGTRVSKTIGGEDIQEEVFLEEGTPPFAGAVDAYGNRGVWGTFTTYPEASASVFSLGSKNNALPMGIHNIARASSTGDNQNITALAYIEQTSSILPRLVIGWGDDSNKGIDKFDTTATLNTVFRSRVFNIGRKFQIKRIRVGLGADIAANHSIFPAIYIDDLSSSVILTGIDTTSHSGLRKVVYKEPELTNLIGHNNFFLEFSHEDTLALPILLPIEIDVTTFDNDGP